MKLKNILIALSVVGAFALLGYLYVWYEKAFSPNVHDWDEKEYFYIQTSDNFQDVLQALRPYLNNPEGFEEIASQRSYNSNLIAGRFKLTNGMDSYSLIEALRKNVPVRLTFNNQERIENLAARIADQVEADSTAMMETFLDSTFLEENGFTKESVLVGFLPETYEFYWTVTPLRMRNRMHKEYLKFWDETRKEKAAALGLTPVEVAILASIVQKETSKNDEKAKVAGVYLNRLRIGMPLQADPTVVFAKKLYTNDFDQVIKRVYHKDTELESPYNTYQNVGLPPGPIFMPDKVTIDAVLNAEKHDYVYFCASVDRMGYHEFATTLAQHNQNSRKYSNWLNQSGIR
ncbi:endolytic transglycosylase MltG [Myroides sp. C15-4]|uniref:endolytic transglycosylase MltG n=1 Tax=Myroides sp. C15-4 TaxID=3400532 RepID=UPI003D2F6D15